MMVAVKVANMTCKDEGHQPPQPTYLQVLCRHFFQLLVHASQVLLHVFWHLPESIQQDKLGQGLKIDELLLRLPAYQRLMCCYKHHHQTFGYASMMLCQEQLQLLQLLFLQWACNCVSASCC